MLAPDGYKKLEPLVTKRLRKAWGTPEAIEEARTRLWPSDGRHELSVAVHTVNANLHYPDVVFEHGADQARWTDQWNDEWVTGSMDYLGDVLGDPWVDDLKTGRHPTAPDDPQILFYALAAWLMGEKKADRVVTSITHWPRSPVGGLPDRYWGEISAEDLDSFHRRLIMGRRKRAWADPERPELQVGPHCRYCPARANCPALREAHESGEEW